MSDARPLVLTDCLDAGADLTLDNPFWSFACLIYAQDAVAPACLELQDNFGVQVNALLFMLWLGTRGHSPGEAGYRTLLDSLAPWTGGVVQPLRQARRNWKFLGGRSPAVQAGREALKRSELFAEQIACAYLFRLSERGHDAARRATPERAVTANLDLVLRLAGLPTARRQELAPRLAGAAHVAAARCPGSSA
ncbi:TIGR02444 family protein [Ancylobacter vacuolatus]|uniref:Uncharacterized protein (TIGR02444 family) n=1 Tax=Ancylobacter vacuolatus TaxID=223389 RepID=A0ABU0DE77_9HYPH|nr:TIGR02444 family protein [Ancylobacter vacuolatus]MDQ0346732.1 uncharacterized protein (TIGR02444 family) [Ancylobacter vacuolatus]